VIKIITAVIIIIIIIHEFYRNASLETKLQSVSSQRYWKQN